MSLLPPIITAAVLLWILWRLPFFQLKGCHRLVVPGVFILKIAAGTALWYIYTFYYTDRQWSDIYKYYNDSAVMYEALYRHPLDYIKMLSGIGVDNTYFHTHYFNRMMHWYKPHPDGLYNDGRLIIRFNAFVRIFASGSMHVHTIVMAFLSLCGQVAIFRAISSFFKGKTYWLMAVLMLIPSVLFWSSGILKEGLLFFFLGFFLIAIRQLFLKRVVIFWTAVLLMALYFLILLKIYMLLCMIPALVLVIWYHYHQKHIWLKAGIILLALFSVVWIQYLCMPGSHLPGIVAAKRADFIAQANTYGSGTLFSSKQIDATPVGLAIAIPVALCNAVFRPLPAPKGVLGWCAAIEVCLLFSAGIFSLVFRKRTEGIKQALLVALLLYIVLFLLIIGLTTPVSGALVRYRVPVLPALGILFLLWVKEEKLPVINGT